MANKENESKIAKDMVVKTFFWSSTLHTGNYRVQLAAPPKEK